MADTKASVAVVAASLLGGDKPQRPESRAAILLKLAEEHSGGALCFGDSRTWDTTSEVRDNGKMAKVGVFGALGRRVKAFPKDEHWCNLGAYLRDIERPEKTLDPLGLVGPQSFPRLMARAQLYAKDLARIGGSLLHLPRIAAVELERLGGATRLDASDDALAGLSRATRDKLLALARVHNIEARWRIFAAWLAAGYAAWLGTTSFTLDQLVVLDGELIGRALAWDKNGRRPRPMERNAPSQGPSLPADYERDSQEDSRTFARRILGVA